VSLTCKGGLGATILHDSFITGANVKLHIRHSRTNSTFVLKQLVIKRFQSKHFQGFIKYASMLNLCISDMAPKIKCAVGLHSAQSVIQLAPQCYNVECDTRRTRMNW
jgi:hypothetical protein